MGTKSLFFQKDGHSARFVFYKDLVTDYVSYDELRIETRSFNNVDNKSKAKLPPGVRVIVDGAVVHDSVPDVSEVLQARANRYLEQAAEAAGVDPGQLKVQVAEARQPERTVTVELTTAEVRALQAHDVDSDSYQSARTKLRQSLL